MKRTLLIVLAIACVVASVMAGKRAVVVSAAGVQAPVFEVDPMWPKPLPNHWNLGSIMGVAIDAQDHIWIVHRGAASLERMELYATVNPPAGDCCSPAPAVLEYDTAGNLLAHWGGPGAGYDWPAWVHSVAVDGKGNVWIAGGPDSGLPPEPGRGGRGGAGASGGRGGSGRGAGGRGAAAAAPRGGVILKFTADGKFLAKIGDPNANANSNDTANLKGPAAMAFDKAANELYVADGYGARRVIVFDADTGAFKRLWGAYGAKPDDAAPGKYDPAAPPSKQFGSPVRCVQIANDGTVYVCDPVNNRIQVFKKDGTFVREAFLQKKTLGDGSVWQIGFSRDPQQRFLYVADGSNDKVRILNRTTLEAEANFGDGGRQPGGFYGVSGVATDSKGNLYTVEAYRGNRVQKFVYKGLGTVTKEDEGYLWPKR